MMLDAQYNQSLENILIVTPFVAKRLFLSRILVSVFAVVIMKGSETMKKAKKQNKELVLAEIPKGANLKIRITVSFFNGTKLAHLREWFKDQSTGAFKPGKNGLTFGSIDSFQAFVRSLLIAEKKVIRAISK